MVRHDAGGRIDREGHDFFGMVLGDFLDIHAAFGRDHEGDARGFPIDQRGQIEFAVDGRAFLDIEAVDLLAVRAGLMRDQGRAEDAGRFLFHVVDGFHHFDAAGLAAPAGMNLRLPHPNRPAQFLGAFKRFVDGESRHAARHWHAEFAQHRFGLILVNVHAMLPAKAAALVLVAEIGRDLRAGLDQALHRSHRLFEHVAFGAVELDLDDALDALGANHHRHADVKILDAVLAIEPGGAGQHTLLVEQIALRHGEAGRRGRVDRGAGLEQVDDFCAAIGGAFDDLVDARLRGPAHSHQIGHRDAGHRRIARQRHHAVAMAAKHEGGDVFHRDIELVGEEIAEARRVEDAGHADHLLLRQAAGFLQRPHHGVERIGDADHEGIRRVFLDAGADLPHHLEIYVEQIVAAHARLARHAGGDDAHIGAVDRFIGVSAGYFGVEIVDRRGLGDIERLTLRDAFHDVEHHDVAELFEADKVGERAADLASADQRNLVTRHGGKTLDINEPDAWWLSGPADNNKTPKDRAQSVPVLYT